MRSQRIRRYAALGATVLVLGFVFAAYLRPSFIVDLANRIVLCF